MEVNRGAHMSWPKDYNQIYWISDMSTSHVSSDSVPKTEHLQPQIWRFFFIGEEASALWFPDWLT